MSAAGGMSSVGGAGAGGAAGADQRVRVVVAGRIGPIEQALRRDARVELVRARGAVDAIGELSDPIDDQSPRSAAVVVGVDAEPRSEQAGVHAWAAALREVEPRVKLVRVVTDAGDAVPAGVYDAQVRVDQGGEALLAAVLGIDVKPMAQTSVPAAKSSAPAPAVHVPATPAPPVVAKPEQRSTAAPASSVMTSATETAKVGEGLTGFASQAALAAAVMEGRQIEAVAMATLRRELSPSVHFVPMGSEAGEAIAAKGLASGDCAGVEHNGRLFGFLSARGVREGTLREAAAWLGAWMALAHQQNELRTLSVMDDLTGAYNRRYFERYADKAVEHGKRTRTSFSVLLLDVDNFKYFNDKFGHGAGDEILVEMVKLLKSTIRPNDRVCRIGGDELAVILFDPDGPRDRASAPLQNAWQIAKRFQQQVYDHRFPKLLERAPGRLSVSGGLATYPWDGLTHAELLKAADDRLLEAKRQGKDRIIMGLGREGETQ